jgi:hypothetical protein
VGRAFSTNRGEEKYMWDMLGKPEGKKQLGRPRRRWVYNIKMVLRESGWGAMAWNDLTQDRDQSRAPVDTVVNLRVQYNAGELLSS